MNICIIANGFPTPDSPQFGCFEKDQAVALKKMGHEVTVIYIDIRFRYFKQKFGITHFVKDGINVYGIYWFPFFFIKYLNYQYKDRLKSFMFDKVFRYMLLKQKKPDVLYAHYLYNIAFGVHLKEKYNIPLVGLEHWSALMKNNYSQRIKELGVIAYNKADKLLAVSESLSNTIYKYFKRKPIVLHNMVGQEFIDAQAIQKRKTGDVFTFIAIGSLLPIKGFDLLIEAFDRFQRTNEKKCKLIIIGEGPERVKLQKLIETLSLIDTIKLVGRKTKTEIISYLQNSDIFVLSSHSETFSVGCIEAMA